MNIVADGIQVLKGENKKTNKPYNFMYLHFRVKKADTDGVACIKQYIDLNNFPQATNIKVGSNISLEYDESGNISFLEIIPNKA